MQIQIYWHRYPADTDTLVQVPYKYRYIGKVTLQLDTDKLVQVPYRYRYIGAGTFQIQIHWYRYLTDTDTGVHAPYRYRYHTDTDTLVQVPYR